MSIRRRFIVVFISAIGFILLFAHPASALPLPGAGVVSNAIGSGVNDAFGSMATHLTSWVLDSLNTFTGGIANFLGTASTPGVDAVWFSGPSSPYASVRSIAVTMLLGFFLLGTMTGLLRNDVGGMLRRMIGALPAAIFGMIAAPKVTAQLLDLTDSLSSAVLANTGGDALQFLTTFGVAIQTTSGGFGLLVLALLAIASALMLWIELLLRSALVYFLVALSPLAFAAIVWPTARGVLRRLMELLVGAIFAKLVICVALAVGVAALGGAGHAAGGSTGVGTAIAAGIGSLTTGTTLLTLASWSPFLLMRMMPIVETAVIAQGISRGPMRVASSITSTANSAVSITRLAGSSATNSSPSRLRKSA